jgi:hypothetical protein
MSSADCGEEFQAKVGEAASNLYQLAVQLLSNVEEAVTTVESLVSKIEAHEAEDCTSTRIRMTNEDGSQDEFIARPGEDGEVKLESRRRLVALSLKKLAARGSSQLAVPDEAARSRKVCVDCEDLAASGITPAVFEDMLSGTGSAQVREWLDGLDPVTRTVFVLRATAGFSSVDTAQLLVANGGAAAVGWTQAAVSNIYRAGLCSLAANVIHLAGRG